MALDVFCVLLGSQEWAPRGASFAVSGLVSLKETARRVTLQLRQQTRGQTGLNLKRNVFPWFSPTSENLHFLAHLPKMGQGGGKKWHGSGKEPWWGRPGWTVGETWFHSQHVKISFIIINNNNNAWWTAQECIDSWKARIVKYSL